MGTSRKVAICLIIIFLPLAALQAQFQFQTVIDKKLGSGMGYRKVVEKTQPWSIDVLEADLTDPNLLIESVKGLEVLTQPAPLNSREITSKMAARSNRSGHRVVAAINADFFEKSGEPVNMQVEKGEIVHMPILRSLFGVTPDNKPLLDIVDLNAWIKMDTAKAVINAVNAVRVRDFLVLYNHFYGSSTGTNEWGTEAQLTPLDAWMVNDTVRCSVDSIVHRIGNLKIPAGRVVLSAHGVAEEFIAAHLRIRDTVQVCLGVCSLTDKIKELVGGMPRLVRGGQSCVAQSVAEEGGANMAYVRHPRTAVGFNQDSTRLFLVVVDGRQPALSNGMTFPELADFLMSLGVYEGVNLDGGGSSTMVVRDQVVNSPSDGKERAVANALMMISIAPDGPADSLEINPRRLRILQGSGCTFRIRPLDSHYHYLDVDSSRVVCHVDPRLGQVSSAGLFIAGTARDSGFVIFGYDAVRDSAFITIKTLEKMTIFPKQTKPDTSQTVAFRVETLDSDGGTQPPACEWFSTNPEVGTVSSSGLFTPRHSGETRIIVRACGLSDTARVTVGHGGSVPDGL